MYAGLLMYLQGESFGETGDAHGAVFELGAFVGDLAVEEDASM